MNKGNLLRFIVLFFLCTSIVRADEKAPLGQKIKIAGIVSLSGDSAELGQGIRDGMLLAHKELSKNLQSQIELQFEDDRFSPAQSVSAFRKLTNVDQVDAIVSFGSACSHALAPLAEQAKIPMIAIALDPKVSVGKSWVMSLFMSPKTSAETLVPEALRKGYKNIAQITTLNDASLSIQKAFDELSSGKIKIGLSEEVEPSSRDFRVFITKLKADPNIDAIMPNLMPGQMGLFAKQVRDSGIKQPFFGHNFLGLPNEIAISNGALQGAWYVEMQGPASSYLEAYKRDYKQSPTVFSAAGYDAVKLIAKVLSDSSTREKLNNNLHQVQNFNGALGIYSATEGNRFNIPAVIKVVS